MGEEEEAKAIVKVRARAPGRGRHTKRRKTICSANAFPTTSTTKGWEGVLRFHKSHQPPGRLRPKSIPLPPSFSPGGEGSALSPASCPGSGRSFSRAGGAPKMAQCGVNDARRELQENPERAPTGVQEALPTVVSRGPLMDDKV